MIEDTVIKYISQHFELYSSQEVIYGFLYNLHRLEEMSEETLKCHCVNLHLKLNSDWHETGMYEELILFRRIVLRESSALDVLKCIFQNNLSEFEHCHHL